MPDSTKLAKVLFRIFVVIAILRTLGLAAFMVDPLRTSATPRPWEPFYLDHNCLTAYYRGTELAMTEAENLYVPDQYRPAGKIGRFDVDEYYYPPQFLLLPRLLIAVGGDFFGVRTLWFILELIFLLAGLWSIYRYIDDERQRAWWLVGAAVFWCSTSNMITLQVGNLQPMAFAMAVMAMIAFDRGRGHLGGLMLAFATLSKIYPGILLVYLLAKRRYRDLGLVALYGILLTAGAWMVFGTNPYADFLQYMLPRIASNEAFAFLDLEQFWWLRAINHSIPGLGQKIGNLIGIMPSPGTTRIFSTVYGLAVLALAWYAGRKKPVDRLHEVQLWLVLITLGALRSPFVPDIYAMIGPLWLWALLVAEMRGRHLFALAALFLPMALILPLGGGWDFGLHGKFLLWSLVAQVPSLFLIFWMLFRTPRRDRDVLANDPAPDDLQAEAARA